MWPEPVLLDLAGCSILKVAYSRQKIDDEDYSAFFFYCNIEASSCLTQSTKSKRPIALNISISPWAVAIQAVMNISRKFSVTWK